MNKHFAIFLSICSFIVSILALVLSFADIETGKLEFSANSFLSVIGTVITTLGFVFGIYFALLAVKAYGDIKKIEEQAETINQHNTNVNNQARTIQEHLRKIEEQVKTIEGQVKISDTQVKEVEANRQLIKDQFEKIQGLDQNAETIKNSINEKVETITHLAQKAEEDHNSINSMLISHQDNYMMTIEYQMELNSTQKKSLDEENPNDQALLKLLSNYWTHLTRMRAKTSYFFPRLGMEKRKQFMVELGGLGDEEDLPHLQKILNSENEADDFKEIVRITMQNIEDKLQNKSST